MKKLLFHWYGRLFARPCCYRFNRLLFFLGLRGIGILNFENDEVSGEGNFLRRFLALNSNPVVVDVGAHQGRFSNRVVQLSPAATVVAFEPHPETFGKLQEEAGKHGYTVVNKACADHSGILTMYDYADESGGSEHASAYGEVFPHVHGGAVASWSAEATTLDQFAREHKLFHIHLLKIDAEGGEATVLRGAQGLIRDGRIDVIQLEFNFMNVFSRTFFFDFHSLLPEFSFFRLLPNGWVPLDPYRPELCELFAFQNIIAVRRGSPLSERLLRG